MRQPLVGLTFVDWVKEEEMASRLRVKRDSDERHLNEEEDEEDEKDVDEYVQEEKYEEYGEKQGYDDEIDEEEDEEENDDEEEDDEDELWEEDDDEDELWDDYGNTKEDDNNAGERSRLHRTDKRKASSSSKYQGVSLDKRKKSKPWRAQISIDGKTRSLGNCATEEEAARAFDAEGARLGRELNFPEEWKDVEDIEEKYEALSYKGKRKASSSKYRGVCRDNSIKSKPWRAHIKIDGKLKYLGVYATEEEAARAYDAEGARLGRKLNFPKKEHDLDKN